MLATSAAPALNERQRAYLLAIFEVDQAVEADIREIPYRPFQQRPKASEWRWQEYSEPVPEIQKPASRLYEAIKKTAPIDQGTGATFAALADRKLVEVDWREYNVYGQRKPYIRLTTAGRKLARSWTGQKAYKAPPAGTLREWHWRALARAYTAGDEGLEGEFGVYAHMGDRTWLRLLEYKTGALVEERETSEFRDHRQVHRMHIIAAGSRLYETEWNRYHELYPGVEAPEPALAEAAAP